MDDAARVFGWFYYFHPWPYYYYEPPSQDYFIRLTFGSDGKLQSWKRVVR